jgi:hypothetical protein
MGGFLEYLDSKEQNLNKIEEAKKQTKPVVKQPEKKKVVVVKKAAPIPKKIIKEETIDHAINILEGINDEDSILNDQDVNQIHNKSKVTVVEDVTDHASALL